MRTASFSPDGTRIVTTSNEKTARVWDTSTGASLAELNGHMETLQSASFSPDGTRIVTASDDKTARVWDASTGASLAELKGHVFGVTSASFSPDGTRIVTTSLNTARIWDGIPDRIRYAEFFRRERGEKDINLGVQYMKEVRGEAPATWLSDPTSDIGRPDFSPVTTRPVGTN